MDSWKFEQALGSKADRHDVHRLSDELRSLKHENDALKERLSMANSAISNQRQAIILVIDLMIDSGSYVENNALLEIKQYL